MRRRRGAIVLAASAAAHLGLLAAWMSTRPELKLAEPPVMEIQLVRPPRAEPPPRRPTASPPVRPRVAHADLPASIPPLVLPAPPKPAAPTPAPPRALTDEELLAGPRPTAQQLRDGPIVRSGGDFRGFGKIKRCNPDAHPGEEGGCPVAKSTPDLEAAGRYRRAMKTYHEAPGGAGYPGIGCAIFHRC